MSRWTQLWHVVDRMTTVAVLCAALVTMWMVSRGRIRAAGAASTTAQSARTAVQRLDNVETTLTVTAKGSKDARVALVEFSDFQCPYCGRFARETLTELQKTFIDTGRLLFVFRNFPLESIHAVAFEAAEAAECAREQDRYWEMHDRLFQRPSEMNRRGLLSSVEALSLDQERFRTCLEHGRMAGKVREDLAEGKRLNVSSTPTFFLGILGQGGQIKISQQVSGAVRFETLKTMIDQVDSISVTAQR